MEAGTERTENYLGTIQVHTKIKENKLDKIESFSDVKARYSRLEDEQKEHLYAVFLNAANEEIGDELVALGSTREVSFAVKDIARTGVLVNAAAVILVHNHPSGNPRPTRGDIEVTEEINQALEPLGINLLDHVVIGRSQATSMRSLEKGPFTPEVNN